MTQKELSYAEDAIGHEMNIISILEESVKNLQDEDLVSFIEGEIQNHTTMKEDLMSLLEDAQNE